MIRIVQADLSRAGDQADTLRLLNAYSCDPMGDGRPLSEVAMRDVIPGLRQHPTTMIFLAYAGAEAVGMAICFLGFSTFAARPLIHILDFFVSPAHRAAGVGRTMLDAVAERGRELGCCRLALEVQEHNHHARRIYDAAGFAQAVYAPEAGGSLHLHRPL